MTFPFLRLPPELRNRIYDLALCTPGEIYPVGCECYVVCSDEPGAAAEKLSININLLQTCKMIHAEGSALLYGANRFLFGAAGVSNLSGLYPFLVRIGRSNRLQLRHLTISIPKLTRFAWEKHISGAQVLGESFDLLSLGHGLRVLELQFQDTGPVFGRRCRDFFTSGTRVVDKLMKIKHIKELVLTGSDPGPEFYVMGVSFEVYLMVLYEDMLVGTTVEEPNFMNIEDPTIEKTITDRLAGLEKSLLELGAHHQDLAVKSKAAETMIERIWSLQERYVMEAQVAVVKVEELLLPHTGLGETVTAELKSLKGELTAQEEDMSRVLKPLGKKVDALTSRI